ncbi:MAG: SixA phosphatase family protein [Gemmatimonadales bacterium]
MLLLLIRHADAGDRDPVRYPDDTLRELTARGMEVQAEMSKALRKRDLTPEVVFSSLWTRAWQTAEILAAVTRSPARPVQCHDLAGTPDPERLARALGEQPPDRIVALVGHEPWLGELGSWLLAGGPQRMAIDFPKSGVLGIELRALEAGTGTLRFFLRPKLV